MPYLIARLFGQAECVFNEPSRADKLSGRSLKSSSRKQLGDHIPMWPGALVGVRTAPSLLEELPAFLVPFITDQEIGSTVQSGTNYMPVFTSCSKREVDVFLCRCKFASSLKHM
jgi:hypothetical protein